MSDSSFPRPPARRIDSRLDDASSERVSADAESSEASRSSERPLRREREAVAEVVAFPRPVSQKRRRPEPPLTLVAHGSEPDEPGEEELERPAYLASELLREDWFPGAPLHRTRRWGALILGGAGAAGTIAVGGFSMEPLLMAAALTCCALVALFPLRASHRGVTVALLGVAGVTYATWIRAAHDAAAPLLTFGAVLAASALLFRGAHRTSRLARALVAVGLITLAGWLVLSGGLQALIVEQLVWQAAAGPLVRVVLGLALIAGVLTFLDPNGRGGAWILSPVLLICLGLEVLVTFALATWPGPDGDATLDSATAVAFVATPFLAAVAAGGLSQVWVLVSGTADAPRELAAQ